MAAPQDAAEAERVRQLQADANNAYKAAQSPEAQAAARNALAEARIHGNEAAGS